MIIDRPIEADFIERPNRFTIIASIGGKRVSAHLKDPGRLKEFMVPGNRILLRMAPRKSTRKTRFDVIAMKRADEWVLVNSGFHSALADELVNLGFVDEFKGFKIEKREYVFGKSRLDFLLSSNGNRMLLEVKGCTLVRDDVALFPDAPTDRGRRHVEELINALESGYESAILFLIFGEKAEIFLPNEETDPEFASALRRAIEAGVKAIPFSFSTHLNGSVIVEPIKRLKMGI